MGSMDRVEDLTFRVNFSGDGAAKLRDRVNDKLKEFMGDYTDDTLVEYVIVLLRNGRRMEEARNELNVFLGDDSDPFVSWLWDHLASNLDLYVPPPESQVKEYKTQSSLKDRGGKNDSFDFNPDSGKANSEKVPRSRHNREWKGLVRDTSDPPPLRSSEVNIMHLEERNRDKINDRIPPSAHPSQKKRVRNEEREPSKRDVVPQSNINASRRLLQFAVRDAVGISRPVKEPSLKRLRSIVSTSEESSLPDQPRRLRSVARVVNPMATVIKAVAEASEDVKAKSGGSVFDRLGRSMDVSEIPGHHAEFRKFVVEDHEYGDLNHTLEENPSIHLHGGEYTGHQVRDVPAWRSETGLASEFMYDNEGYGEFNAVGHDVTDVSRTGTSSGNKGDDSVMVQYNVANDNEVIQPRRDKDWNPSVEVGNSSRKIVNISVNVNTWKAPQYQVPGEVSKFVPHRSAQASEVNVGKSSVQLLKENDKSVTIGNGNAKPTNDIQKDPQKLLQSDPGSSAAVRTVEDADSRTIFVSNVHFAATKDSLSRHFNKFGEVLKVVIVTDAATGQPKGSAYVEFMRKEAADSALSLDGTSYMSRLLKVVKRSPANQETAPTMTRPQIARGASFAAGRFPRASFGRGMPGTYRPWLAVKPGSRSMQWKRDAQPSPTESGTPGPRSNVSTPTGRGLTYVRTETK